MNKGHKDLLKAAHMALSLFETYAMQGMSDGRFLEETAHTEQEREIARRTIETRDWLKKVISSAETKGK